MLLSMLELCEEAAWYSDKADTVKVFKEILAISDSHPELETGEFTSYASWKDFMLWTYETFLDAVKSFYNIPLEECKSYISDFGRRWTAYGYDSKEPYRMELELCLETGSIKEAAALWEKYIKIPAIYNSQNKNGYLCKNTKLYSYLPTEIKYYLANNQLQKAKKILDRIQETHFTAGIGHVYSVQQRARRIFLEYYIINGNYEEAAEISYILEHSNYDEKEFISWASFMCSYVYTRTGRGLRIYRNHWEEWENEKNPQYRYYIFKNAACFFKALKKARNTNTIKIRTGNTFPFYNEDKIYDTGILYSYYYKKAAEIAKKFDQRNGTDCYIKRLETSISNAGKKEMQKQWKTNTTPGSL